MADDSIVAPIAHGHVHPHPLLVPLGNRERGSHLLQVFPDPIERARAGVAQHHVVEERGVQQGIPEAQHDCHAVRARRGGSGQVDPVIEVGQLRLCHRVGSGAIHVAVCRREWAGGLVTPPIDCAREWVLIGHDEEPVELVHESGFRAPVHDLQQLKLIHIMRLQRFVTDLEAHGSIGRLHETEPIDVPALEYRRDAVGESLRLQQRGAAAVRVDGRAGAENGNRERRHPERQSARGED